MHLALQVIWGVTRGPHFPRGRISMGAPKSPDSVASTFFNTVHLLLKDLGIGRGGKREALAPLDFENFSKKGCFLSFEWEKQISPHLAPLEKFWKNPQWPSRKKSF